MALGPGPPSPSRRLWWPARGCHGNLVMPGPAPPSAALSLLQLQDVCLCLQLLPESHLVWQPPRAAALDAGERARPSLLQGRGRAYFYSVPPGRTAVGREEVSLVLPGLQ